MSRKHRFLENTLFSGLPRFLGWGLSFFLTPFLIGSLGLEYFGVWTILNTLSGYLFIIDFGFATSVVHFVAEAHSRDNKERLFEIISTSLALYVFLSLVITGIFFFFSADVVRVLNLTADSPEIVEGAVRISAFLFSISMMTLVLHLVLDGIQKMNLTGAISSLTLLASNLMTFPLLYLGGNLQDMCVLFLVCQLIGLGVSVGVFLSHFGIPRLVPMKMTLFKEMAGYGGKLQVSSLAYIFTIRAESVIITSVLNSAAVGYYRIGHGLASLTRDIPSLMLNALLPTATMLGATSERETLNRLFHLSSRYLFFAAIHLAFFTIAFADSLIRIWLNSNAFVASALLLQLLTFGYLFNILTGAATALARAIKKIDIEFRINLALLLLHVSLNFFFLMWKGAEGIAIAGAICFPLTSLFILYRLAPLFGTTLMDLFKTYFFPSALMSLVLLVVLKVAHPMFVDAAPFLSLRGKELAAVGLCGTIYGVCVLGLSLRFGLIRLNDFKP